MAGVDAPAAPAVADEGVHYQRLSIALSKPTQGEFVAETLYCTLLGLGAAYIYQVLWRKPGTLLLVALGIAPAAFLLNHLHISYIDSPAEDADGDAGERAEPAADGAGE